MKKEITIYKYKPDLQEKPKYFKSELDLLKQLKKDMQEDIEINKTSDIFLIDESLTIGETIILEFDINQATRTLTELLNQNTKYKTEVYHTECYKCREQIEYTEIHSFCPNCLTSI